MATPRPESRECGGSAWAGLREHGSTHSFASELCMFCFSAFSSGYLEKHRLNPVQVWVCLHGETTKGKVKLARVGCMWNWKYYEQVVGKLRSRLYFYYLNLIVCSAASSLNYPTDINQIIKQTCAVQCWCQNWSHLASHKTRLIRLFISVHFKDKVSVS